MNKNYHQEEEKIVIDPEDTSIGFSSIYPKEDGWYQRFGSVEKKILTDGNDFNIDGGTPSSIYTPSLVLDGGTP